MLRLFLAALFLTVISRSVLPGQSLGISPYLSVLSSAIESEDIRNSRQHSGGGIQIWYSKTDKKNPSCRHRLGLDYSGYLPASYSKELILIEKQTNNYISTNGQFEFGVQNFMFQYNFQFPFIYDAFLHAGIGFGLGISRTHYNFKAEGYDLNNYTLTNRMGFSGNTTDILADGVLSIAYEFEHFFIFGEFNAGYTLVYTDPFLRLQARLSAGIILPLIQNED